MSAAAGDAVSQEQGTRLRRTLFGCGAAGAMSAVLVILFLIDATRLDAAGLVFVLGGLWLVNVAFVAAILTDLNLRLPDPSMTLAQIVWATLVTFVIVYFIDDGRHLVIMVYLLAMMFGAFRLDVSEYLLVTLIALVLYGVVIAALSRLHPASIDPRREALGWLVFFIVMVGFSLLGSETSRLRAALERRNRQLREARDAAAVADRAKSRFLATTSHELRTPLNMIVGSADAIGEAGLSAAQRDALARARHAGDHLLTLINSMIDLSKLESGDLELRPSTFDLQRQLDDIHAMVTPLASERPIELVLEVASDVGQHVHGDAARLNEVLVHLVSNALKFTDAGEVRLTAGRDTRTGSQVRFAVADTGCGIAPRTLASLFQPFTPGDAGSTRATGGSGLGLALCRRLVELMGGTLEAHSIEGEGSRFSFAIPLPATTPSGRLTHPAPGDELRVLVVDDSPDNRLLMRAFLKNDVARVDTAENGPDGLGQFANARYDVVLMDMHMPGMDGLEATRRMRALEADREGPGAAILALTADDSAIDRERSLAAGCDDHLVKPIAKKALLAALAEHAAARAAGGATHRDGVTNPASAS